MSKTLNVRVKTKNATATEWSNSTLVLLKGEMAIESDTGRIKVGDGVNVYKNLPYIHNYSFGNVKVGNTTLTAKSTNDTLTLVAGANITLTPSTTNNQVTIIVNNVNDNANKAYITGTNNTNSTGKQIFDNRIYFQNGLLYSPNLKTEKLETVDLIAQGTKNNVSLKRTSSTNTYDEIVSSFKFNDSGFELGVTSTTSNGSERINKIKSSNSALTLSSTDMVQVSADSNFKVTTDTIQLNASNTAYLRNGSGKISVSSGYVQLESYYNRFQLGTSSSNLFVRDNFQIEGGSIDLFSQGNIFIGDKKNGSSSAQTIIANVNNMGTTVPKVVVGTSNAKIGIGTATKKAQQYSGYEVDTSITTGFSIDATKGIQVIGTMELSDKTHFHANTFMHDNLDMGSNDIKEVKNLYVNKTLHSNGDLYTRDIKPIYDNVYTIGGGGIARTAYKKGYINQIISDITGASAIIEALNGNDTTEVVFLKGPVQHSTYTATSMNIGIYKNQLMAKFKYATTSQPNGTEKDLVLLDMDGNSSFPGTVKGTFSGSLKGNADTATKLNGNNVGSVTKPVYFSNGVPTACTYSLSKDVPSNAVFTDTDTKVTQTVTTTNANFPVLLGSSGQTTTLTQGANFGTKITANPNTGTVTATTFSGSLSGNASTATKLNGNNVGNATTPVYFSGGVPTVCSNNFGQYLPLSGGTITGDVTLNKYLKLNAWSNYGTGAAELWFNGNTKTICVNNNTATDIALNSSSASKVKNALTLQINGANSKTFDGSSAQTFNVTIPTINNSTITIKQAGTEKGKFTLNQSGNTTIELTDNNTVYTHPTTSGNKHIPSGGSAGQFLKWSSDGTAVWANDNNTWTAFKGATSTAAGTAGYISAVPTSGQTGLYFRSDGSWATPPDTKYTHPTTAGNKHIPTGGSSGQLLGYSANGEAKWVEGFTAITDTELDNMITEVFG